MENIKYTGVSRSDVLIDALAEKLDIFYNNLQRFGVNTESNITPSEKGFTIFWAFYPPNQNTGGIRFNQEFEHSAAAATDNIPQVAEQIAKSLITMMLYRVFGESLIK